MTSIRVPLRAFAAAAVLIATAVSTVGVAQTPAAYPEKPVRLVVPYPAGGPADTVARLIADRASAALGQAIVIDNRAGAAGTIGAAAVARSPGDGYTILFGTQGSQIVSPLLYKNPGYDPTTDLLPVTKLTNTPMLLLVSATSPIRSGTELIADLKANPGKRTFGSGSSGQHVAGEMFKLAAGVDMLHVPYKGNAPATIDLLAGRIDLMLDVMASAYPQVKAGKLRAIAVLSKEAEPNAPEIPPIASFGIPIEIAAWDAIFVPAGTPRTAIDRLNAAFRAALVDPKVSDALVARGVTPMPTSPDDLARQIRDEMPRWAEAVKRSGAKVE